MTDPIRTELGPDYAIGSQRRYREFISSVIEEEYASLVEALKRIASGEPKHLVSTTKTLPQDERPDWLIAKNALEGLGVIDTKKAGSLDPA